MSCMLVLVFSPFFGGSFRRSVGWVYAYVDRGRGSIPRVWSARFGDFNARVAVGCLMRAGVVDSWGPGLTK